MSRVASIFLSFILFIIIYSLPASALTVESRGALGLDEKLSHKEVIEDLEYKNKVQVFQLNTLNARYANDCKEWIKALYYYLTTRLAYTDLPFHIIFCNDKFYESSRWGVYQKIENDGSDHSLNVLYLNNNQKLSDEVFSELITRLNSYGVNKEDVKAKSFRIIINEDNSSTKLIIDDSAVISSLRDLVNRINSEISTTSEIPGLTLDSITLDTSNDEAGTKKFIVKLKNFSNQIIFGDKNAVNGLYITEKNNRTSRSNYYNDETSWATLTKAYVLNNDVLIKPRAEVTLNFKIKDIIQPPLGEFQLVNLIGKPYSGSSFTLNNKTGEVYIANSTESNKSLKIVEIGYTPTGYLNGRTLPSLNSNIILRVYPGEQYLLVDTSNSWYKIEVNGTNVWISATYSKIIN